MGKDLIYRWTIAWIAAQSVALSATGARQRQAMSRVEGASRTESIVDAM